MSRARDYHVYHTARSFIFKIILKLQRDGDLRGVLELERYFRDLELELQEKLSAAYDAGGANRIPDYPDAA